ncbi:unnamed protein product [Timema podura]|uniref:Ribosomal protein S21 n=1 Tax=Timema podura TaxID=61482 RepID=A0ABN7P8Q9_TIMPD|nr:unnamed protein product [Timema podura]
MTFTNTPQNKRNKQHDFTIINSAVSCREVHKILEEERLRWYGHVMRMEKEKIPYKMEMKHVGKRLQERQRKRLEKQIKASVLVVRPGYFTPPVPCPAGCPTAFKSNSPLIGASPSRGEDPPIHHLGRRPTGNFVPPTSN